MSMRGIAVGVPIRRMTFAYAMLSVMILAISGKCQPYHSCETMSSKKGVKI